MGIRIYVTLIDRRASARVADVHRGWVERRDAGAVLDLLREALDRARKLLPPGPPRQQRMDEIRRRIDALPPTPAEEEDRARFGRQIVEATRRMNEARERGDASAMARKAAELSRSFFATILAPLERNDQHGALLKEMFALGDDPPGPEIEHVEQLESAIAVFSDPAATPEQREDAFSWSRLLDAYAFAWNREPRAEVEVNLLLPFDDSAVLQGLAMGAASGETFEFDDPSVQLFTAEQVTAFRDELRRLPEPPPNSQERVARLRRLVELAASDPQLALATWSG